MTQRKIPKKEITADARQLLKQGTSKQQTFETLVDKYKYAKDVADIVRYIPSSQALKKYGKWNDLLFALLILYAVFIFITSPSIGTLFWYGFLVYAVVRKLTQHYMWVSILAAFYVIAIVAVVLVSENTVTHWDRIAIMLAFLIPTVILPLWLQKKLSPEPTERKEQYTNSEGEQRMRIVYEFNEEATNPSMPTSNGE